MLNSIPLFYQLISVILIYKRNSGWLGRLEKFTGVVNNFTGAITIQAPGVANKLKGGFIDCSAASEVARQVLCENRSRDMCIAAAIDIDFIIARGIAVGG